MGRVVEKERRYELIRKAGTDPFFVTGVCEVASQPSAFEFFVETMLRQGSFPRHNRLLLEGDATLNLGLSGDDSIRDLSLERLDSTDARIAYSYKRLDGYARHSFDFSLGAPPDGVKRVVVDRGSWLIPMVSSFNVCASSSLSIKVVLGGCVLYAIEGVSNNAWHRMVGVFKRVSDEQGWPVMCGHEREGDFVRVGKQFIRRSLLDLELGHDDGCYVANAVFYAPRPAQALKAALPAHGVKDYTIDDHVVASVKDWIPPTFKKCSVRIHRDWPDELAAYVSRLVTL